MNSSAVKALLEPQQEHANTLTCLMIAKLHRQVTSEGLSHRFITAMHNTDSFQHLEGLIWLHLGMQSNILMIFKPHVLDK